MRMEKASAEGTVAVRDVKTGWWGGGHMQSPGEDFVLRAVRSLWKVLIGALLDPICCC